jgi:flavin-binding protein dodecin
MSDHIYKHIELTGSSAVSTDEAIRQAIKKASETIDDIHWFNVLESRGEVHEGKITFWQVTLKIGFRING